MGIKVQSDAAQFYLEQHLENEDVNKAAILRLGFCRNFCKTKGPADATVQDDKKSYSLTTKSGRQNSCAS